MSQQISPPRKVEARPSGGTAWPGATETLSPAFDHSSAPAPGHGSTLTLPVKTENPESLKQLKTLRSLRVDLEKRVQERFRSRPSDTTRGSRLGKSTWRRRHESMPNGSQRATRGHLRAWCLGKGADRRVCAEEGDRLGNFYNENYKNNPFGNLIDDRVYLSMWF